MNKKKFLLGAPLLFSVVTDGVYAQRSCRNSNRRPNHVNSLWEQDFPNDQANAVAICEGTVSMQQDSGEICINGRVNYQQLMEELDNPSIWQPAARTISVNGHLTAGSCNVVLGGKTRYLYDFVTSYTINGTSYVASERSNIVDDLLAASRGTIDAVCFSSDFQQEEERFYSISHRAFALDSIDYDLLRNRDDIGLVFFGNVNSVVEFHNDNIDPPSRFQSLSSRARLNAINAFVYATPSFVYGLLPVFVLTGTTRLATAGVYSTRDFPNPFTAPDTLGAIEGVQIDTPWETIVSAAEAGLFSGDDRVPIWFNVVIKRIVAVGTNYKCWGEAGRIMASIDIEAPLGFADELDDYIENTIYPKLVVAGGPVAIHFGKRSPPNSSVLTSAMNFYESCGVETNLQVAVEDCIHPLCERKPAPSVFHYPPAYYKFI